MSVREQYLAKRVAAVDALRVLRDGDCIIVPTGVGEPPTLLAALSERRRDFHDVKVAQILAMRPFAYIDPTTAAHVRHVALFYGSATRAGGQAGWVDFIPSCFSEIPSLIERGKMAADVVFSMASPMDAHGYFSLSLAADYTMAAIARARAVVLEVNPHVPFAFGNEMIGDGILSLVACGAVTNRRKNHLPGKMVATFALGSRKLYDFIDRNPALEIHPVDFTNDPSLAGLNDKLVAINATLQIDLLGQCGSESLGHLPYSGTGGQSDFVRAANRSRGGKAIIVLPSTAKNDSISRIVPALSPGTHVSTSKNDVDYVVTEYGVAQLRGKSAAQRARELIAIAHPMFRAELIQQAKRMTAS